MPQATQFVDLLRSFPALPGTFNPWNDVDPENDAGGESPKHRADHLTRYLRERIGKAKVLLIAEALGYQGGHFSGIAMTSERILLDQQAAKGVHSADVIAGGAMRTSGPTMTALGANEPTATIVWGALKKAGIDTREVVLWNAFALHPMKDGYLTNRKPTDAELKAGRPVLEAFLRLFAGAKTIAVGRVSEEILSGMGVAVAGQVRHPANGGATQFRDGLPALLEARCIKAQG